MPSDRASSTMVIQYVHPADCVEIIPSCADEDMNPPSLIDTMQLVEPWKHEPVPNHILETKVYSRQVQNCLIAAEPSAIHFAGFEPGQAQQQCLKLINIARDTQRMHIIPPQTKYFSIKYTKDRLFVPGASLNCVVEFFPDECRMFYDFVRVHCEGDDNLIIPINAYPVLDISQFPRIIDFSPVPIGQTKTKVFPLRCLAPVDFDFIITHITAHPAFSVQPMIGTVPANGQLDIVITYAPTAFITAVMKIQLEIQQFFSKPFVCTITGYSTPGLTAEQQIALMNKQEALSHWVMSTEEKMQYPLEPMVVTPLDRARQNKLKIPRTSTGIGRTVSRTGTARDQESKGLIIRGGVVIPPNIDNPHAVGRVLMQKPGQLSLKDMRKVMLCQPEQIVTRQMKEATFNMMVRQCATEERQNQLRWQTKLGSKPLAQSQRDQILEERLRDSFTYQASLGIPDVSDELKRAEPLRVFMRTRRDIETMAAECATFDMYNNDDWFHRQDVLSRFRQAACKVMLRRRADRRLTALRKLVYHSSDPLDVTYETALQSIRSQERREDEKEFNMLTVARVSDETFPVYMKDTFPVDTLGTVNVQPTKICLAEDVPYFQLKVPQQYRLLGYYRQDVQAASQSYVPLCPLREIRTGAEEELVGFSELITSQVCTEWGTNAVVPLVPPAKLLQPIKYHHLHIFNPAPGLQTFQNPMPYSEVDADYHLCPLPRFIPTDACSNILKSAQREFLDREEVITSVMTWKKFPSPTIAATVNTPSLATIWAPRWSDPFGNELLPYDLPPLFECISKADHDNLSCEPNLCCDGQPLFQLTPSMVKAEFEALNVESLPENLPEREALRDDQLPTTNLVSDADGPILRESRVELLEKYIHKKRNTLGGKIRNQVLTMNSLKNNPNLSII